MYCVTRRGLIKYELDSAPAILRKCELNDRVSISLGGEGEESAIKQLSKIGLVLTELAPEMD